MDIVLFILRSFRFIKNILVLISTDVLVYELGTDELLSCLNLLALFYRGRNLSAADNSDN